MVRCHGIGVDLSPEAITVARARATALGLERVDHASSSRLEPAHAVRRPLAGCSDVAGRHPSSPRPRPPVSRRGAVARARRKISLHRCGRDYGTGLNAEIRLRSSYGSAQFVPPGCNEQLLELAGFRLLEQADGTTGLLKNAAGRLSARLAHRRELENAEGNAAFETHEQYLETVISLGERGAMSRRIYLAETP